MLFAVRGGLGAIENVPTETDQNYSPTYNSDPWIVSPTGALPSGSSPDAATLPPGSSPLPPRGYAVTPPPETCQVAPPVRIGTCMGVDELDNPVCGETIQQLSPAQFASATAQLDAAAQAFIARTGTAPVVYDYTPPRSAIYPQSIAVNNPIWRYLLYPNAPIPAELLNPAHAPFGPTDPRAAAFKGAMLLFYPQGFFEFSGPTPGRLKPDMIQGSSIRQSNGSLFPYAYWYPMVSEQMVTAAVAFLKAGGFGPEAGDPNTLRDFTAAGAAIGQAVKAGVSAERVFSTAGALTVAAGASAAIPVIGAGIAAGLALFTVFSDLFDDPAPPAWVVRLKGMVNIASQTGGLYWIGPVPYGGAYDMHAATQCNRFWPVKQAKYSLLEGYAEVMCRMAGTTCGRGSGSSFPWWAVALGVGALTLGGVALYKSRQ